MRKTVISLLAFFLLLTAVPAAVTAAPDNQLVRIKGKVRYVESMATYALLGDDGKQYHPTKKLSRGFQHDGLEVVVEARLRPDLVAARMYGTAIEVLQINKAAQYVSPEEREAVGLLLLRMDAFNARNLARLREIDTVAAKLTTEQFDAWVTGWGKFTLHYVEAANVLGPRSTAATIEGVCLYSRERENSMALSGNVQHALMKFTLAKVNGKWNFSATDAVRPDVALDMEQVIADYLARAETRYGTTNLRKWKG